MEVSTEHWCNKNDRGEPKYSEKNLAQCQFLHQKSHTDCSGTEPVPPRRQATLKSNIKFSYNQMFSPYRTVNTLRLRYKNQSVNTVQGNNNRLY
jgi:hypothetical protein